MDDSFQSGLINIMKYFNLLANMGFRYVIFRIYLYISIKSGLYQKRFPTEVQNKQFLSLDKWRSSDMLRTNIKILLTPSNNSNLNNILDGYCLFFNKKWIFIGNDYDWITNPINDFKYDLNTHWTKIVDYSQKDGDIKYVWEPSRFTFVYEIIRHDYHNKTDHSEWIWAKIDSWIDNNPINYGPNFKCSQEISLRVLNWIYCLNFYAFSGSLTEDRFQKILNAIYWQMKHVYDNIQFSRIAVRNNHAITETLALYIVGSQFPFFKESDKWKTKGKKWFEEEIKYQVYEDGTYLQFSHNYHRVVVQLLNWAFMIADKNNEHFSNIVYERAYASLDFLYHAQDIQTGWLPNYGSNDGALFFPLTECDYRDYRPQLQTLHIFLTGEPLYIDGIWNQDAFFMNARLQAPIKFSPINLRNGWSTYSKGGFYILREDKILTFIRCGGYKDRPAQADNLHIDIWHNGENILYDGGTFQYNTEKTLVNYFSGSKSHNTVIIDDYDQMLKGPRFIWYYWSKFESASTSETAESYIFEGKINVFRFLKANITHKRVITKYKNKLSWEITDEIENMPKNSLMNQLWHISSNFHISTSTNASGEIIIPQKRNGYVSDYYGVKNNVIYYVCTSNQPIIKTKLNLDESIVNSPILSRS